MDPITLSASFATIVGLISNFKAERNSSTENEYQEFLLWLNEKKHKTVIDDINSNHLLSLSIKNTLNQNHEALLLKLAGLDNSISALASKVSGFNEIAHAINPNIEFSDQAISVIEQLSESQGSHFMELKTLGSGATFQIMDGNNGKINYTEPQFIEDDLEILCKHEFLISDYNPQGYRKWTITRQAAKFLKLAKESNN